MSNSVPDVLQRRRSDSPRKASDAGERPTKAVKSGGTFDLRLVRKAEEEAARRQNVGRAPVGNILYGGAMSRAKRSDLFGRAALVERLNALSKDNGITFDDEAMAYIACAAESRIRSLVSSTVSAQIHRTSSSHLRQPPVQSSSSSKPGKAMWSHRITSDANAVLDALSRANKDAEQTFRASRMDRLARETEIQRARERDDKVVEEAAPQEAASDPLTPIKDPSTSNDPPVFGAVSEKKGVKRTGKKAGKDLSADVQLKMSNATAMRSVGMFQKKQYSWLTSVPSVSSPLSGAGKKRKAGKEGTADEEGLPGEQRATSEAVPAMGSEKKQKKGKEKNLSTTSGSPLDEDARPPKRSRSSIGTSTPSRRFVGVERLPNGVLKTTTDDRALTMMDLLFAMERDGSGSGMGTEDEIVRRVWARGGIWKEDLEPGRSG